MQVIKPVTGCVEKLGKLWQRKIPASTPKVGVVDVFVGVFSVFQPLVFGGVGLLPTDVFRIFPKQVFSARSICVDGLLPNSTCNMSSEHDGAVTWRHGREQISMDVAAD